MYGCGLFVVFCFVLFYLFICFANDSLFYFTKYQSRMDCGRKKMTLFHRQLAKTLFVFTELTCFKSLVM